MTGQMTVQIWLTNGLVFLISGEEALQFRKDPYRVVHEFSNPVVMLPATPPKFLSIAEGYGVMDTKVRGQHILLWAMVPEGSPLHAACESNHERGIEALKTNLQRYKSIREAGGADVLPEAEPPSR